MALSAISVADCLQESY